MKHDWRITAIGCLLGLSIGFALGEPMGHSNGYHAGREDEQAKWIDVAKVLHHPPRPIETSGPPHIFQGEQ